MINHALFLGPIEISGRNSDVIGSCAENRGLLNAIFRLDVSTDIDAVGFELICVRFNERG